MRRSFAAVALGACALLAACGDDETLAPPDGVKCTAGAIAAGDTLQGEIAAEGCELWSDYLYGLRVAESWTLRTAKDKVYIVRVRPAVVNGSVNTLDGFTEVYGRNADGDPIILTYQENTYANPSGGGPAMETIIPSRAAMTLSIRVSANDVGDVGGYEITVDECPLRPVPVGTTSAAVVLDASCTLRSLGAPSPAPVAFFSYEARDGVISTLTATRTAGTANFFVTARGPGTDFGCLTDFCNSATSVSGAGPYAIQQAAELDGGTTVAIVQATAGTLSATLGVAQPPVVVMDSPLSRR